MRKKLHSLRHLKWMRRLSLKLLLQSLLRVESNWALLQQQRQQLQALLPHRRP